MYEVNHAHTDNGVDLYQSWLDSLPDTKVKARITTRVERAAQGNFGDSSSVGEGVSELRLHFGPGYRVYYVISGGTILLLLGGGTKQRQQNDIEQAIQIWKAIKG